MWHESSCNINLIKIRDPIGQPTWDPYETGGPKPYRPYWAEMWARSGKHVGRIWDPCGQPTWDPYETGGQIHMGPIFARHCACFFILSIKPVDLFDHLQFCEALIRTGSHSSPAWVLTSWHQCHYPTPLFQVSEFEIDNQDNKRDILWHYCL